jgi:hypothetical protein
MRQIGVVNQPHGNLEIGNYVDHVRLISQGGSSNFSVKLDIKYTWTATGELAVEFTHYSSECTGG